MRWNSRWLNIVINIKIIIKTSKWILPDLLCEKFIYFTGQLPGYNASANHICCHCWHLYQLGISHSLYSYLHITTWEVKRKGELLLYKLQVLFGGDLCTMPEIILLGLNPAIYHGNLDHLSLWLRWPHKVFWAEPWCFPDQHRVVFVPRPKQTVGTALWRERSWKLNRKQTWSRKVKKQKM